MKPTFKPTDEMIQAAKTVFMAMATVETIKPIVREYEKEILKKYQFHIAQSWTEKGIPDEVILDPEKTYLLEDTDFQIYLKDAFQERDKAGLKVDNPEFCPLLVAEHLQCDAEYILIETMEPVTHLQPSNIYGNNRKKLIDLTLKLLAPFVGTARDILTA